MLRTVFLGSGNFSIACLLNVDYDSNNLEDMNYDLTIVYSNIDFHLRENNRSLCHHGSFFLLNSCRIKLCSIIYFKMPTIVANWHFKINDNRKKYFKVPINLCT